MLRKLRIFGGCQKVDSQEKLNEWLKAYNGVLSTEMLDYLNSLINLEFSVVRNIVDEKDRLLLSELKIYERIAMYNIYYRALEIFKNSNRRVKIWDNDSQFEGVGVVSGSKNYRDIFEYNYDRDRTYEVPKCGEIKISQYTFDKEQKQQEIERLKEKLKNTHIGRLRPTVDAEGHELYGPNSLQYANYEAKIKSIQDAIEKIENSMKLSSRDKRIIEISKEFHDLVLEDYGLTVDDFKIVESNSKIYQTSYVKRPKLIIKRNIENILK